VAPAQCTTLHSEHEINACSLALLVNTECCQGLMYGACLQHGIGSGCAPDQHVWHSLVPPFQVGPFTWQPFPVFKAVAERGGYEAVTKAGLWRQVSAEWQQGMAKTRKQPSPVHIHPIHRVSEWPPDRLHCVMQWTHAMRGVLWHSFWKSTARQCITCNMSHCDDRLLRQTTGNCCWALSSI
jgi:hypothetical protein